MSGEIRGKDGRIDIKATHRFAREDGCQHVLLPRLAQRTRLGRFPRLQQARGCARNLGLGLRHPLDRNAAEEEGPTTEVPEPYRTDYKVLGESRRDVHGQESERQGPGHRRLLDQHALQRVLGCRAWHSPFQWRLYQGHARAGQGDRQKLQVHAADVFPDLVAGFMDNFGDLVDGVVLGYPEERARCR